LQLVSSGGQCSRKVLFTNKEKRFKMFASSMVLSPAEFNYMVDLMGPGWLIEVAGKDNTECYLTHTLTGFSFSADGGRRDAWGDLVGFTDEGRAVPAGCWCSGGPDCEQLEECDPAECSSMCARGWWVETGDSVECTRCDAGASVEFIRLSVDDFGMMADEETGEPALDADGEEYDVDPLGGYYSHFVGWLQGLQSVLKIDGAPLFRDLLEDILKDSPEWVTGVDNTPGTLGGSRSEKAEIAAEYRRGGVAVRVFDNWITVIACFPGVGVDVADLGEGDMLERVSAWFADSSEVCPFYVAEVVA
jgi:hypothetical protein